MLRVEALFGRRDRDRRFVDVVSPVVCRRVACGVLVEQFPVETRQQAQWRRLRRGLRRRAPASPRHSIDEVSFRKARRAERRSTPG
jgi:hypothetical protein